MLQFPNAKINLGLYVTGKRPDGYHQIESIFYPVPFNDILEIVESNNFSLQITGKPIEGDDNILTKAFRLLKNKFAIPDVSVHLHKTIPMGAGLGGGSSDAAFFLKMINEKFNLRIPVQKLKELAAELGSDCIFFVENVPSYVSGRGEITEPVNVSLSGYYLLIVNPAVHITTSDAYKNIIPAMLPFNLKIKIESTPLSDWKMLLENCFEKNVFVLYPLLDKIKQELYSNGAIYASMTGSGSCLYGIFKDCPDANPFNRYEARVFKL